MVNGDVERTAKGEWNARDVLGTLRDALERLRACLESARRAVDMAEVVAGCGGGCGCERGGLYVARKDAGWVGGKRKA